MRGQLSARAQTRAPTRGPDPGDQVLIDTMVDQGCDPREAGVWRDHMAPDGNGAYGRRLLRYSALMFYWDVCAVRRGDAAARDRVDFVRHAWNEMGKAQRSQAAEAAELAAEQAPA